VCSAPFNGIRAIAADDRHAAGLQQTFHALDELIDDRGLALLGRAPVEDEPVGDNAEFGAALGQAVQLGRLQQRLRGNATTDQAGAAKPVLLDDRSLGAQLCSP
jgi:hypothetical protein